MDFSWRLFAIWNWKMWKILFKFKFKIDLLTFLILIINTIFHDLCINSYFEQVVQSINEIERYKRFGLNKIYRREGHDEWQIKFISSYNNAWLVHALFIPLRMPGKARLITILFQ